MSSLLGKRKQYDSEDLDDDLPQHKRHKSGHHKPCAPPGYIYRDLEVVWARLEDFPWWPAQCDFTLLDGDKGQNRTPRLPVRWFGEDHNRVDWLTRDRIIPFSLEIESDLVRELKVEDEDQPEYIASIEDAVARQKKWRKDLEKERRQNKESDDEDFDPTAYKRKIRGIKSRDHNNNNNNYNGAVAEHEEEEEDDDDDDDEEENFEVDENGLIIDPEERLRKRRKHVIQKETVDAIIDEHEEKEEEHDSDEADNQDIDLFDDVGDVEKGYIENADDENNESFVVLNDNTIYEQQQNEERVKQMQIQQQQQQQQEMERLRLLEQQQQIQRQQELEQQQQQQQQQYLLQQQMLSQQQQNNNNGQVQYVQNNFNDVNISNVVSYNGLQYENQQQNYNNYNNHHNSNINQNSNYNQNHNHNHNHAPNVNYYAQCMAVETKNNVNVNTHVVSEADRTTTSYTEEAQPQPITPHVPQAIAPPKRKKKIKKRKQAHSEIFAAAIDPTEVTDPSKKDLEEILKNDQFSLKLKEIAEQNEQNRISGNVEKQNKARILKGLPYQLQQEIMSDNYVNKTPSILTEYFAHQNKLKNMDPNDENRDKIPYYPQHFMRMRDKAKKDYRIHNAMRKTKKRSIRTQLSGVMPSADEKKKKAPAYLRVASPEVLEKMHFDKQNRNALTLDHIVTKQYRNRGRKSGFFGSRNRYKRKSNTPQAAAVPKVEQNKPTETDENHNNNNTNDVNNTAVNVNNEVKVDNNEVSKAEKGENNDNVTNVNEIKEGNDANAAQKERSVTPKLKSVSLEAQEEQNGNDSTPMVEKERGETNPDTEGAQSHTNDAEINNKVEDKETDTNDDSNKHDNNDKKENNDNKDMDIDTNTTNDNKMTENDRVDTQETKAMNVDSDNDRSDNNDNIEQTDAMDVDNNNSAEQEEQNTLVKEAESQQEDEDNDVDFEQCGETEAILTMSQEF